MAGIDQQIQTKVDAYRSNPQALQQRYQQNQELLDLLALQKLKSEKDAAARDIQMQMAQSPQTIKQQRERELVDRTKQQMTEQTAGIMQQRQAQQQKNVQKVAQQGAATPQAMQGVQQGLGSLASQVKPQIAKMAAGGIVGYAAGEGVEGRTGRAKKFADLARVRKYREALRATDPDKEAGLTNIEILELLDAQEMQPKTAPTDYKTMFMGDPSAVAETPQGPIVPKMDAPQASKEAPQGPIVPKMETPQAPKEDPTPALGAGLPTLSATEVPAPAMGANEMIASAGLGSLGTSGDAETAARASSDEYLGRKEKADKYGELSGRLAEYDAAANDPEKARRERTSAFLRSTAGTGGFGAMMARGSQGMSDERVAQETAKRSRLIEAIGLEEAAIASDVGIGKTGAELGQVAVQQLEANKRQVLQTMTELSRQDKERIEGNANRALDAEQGNLRAAVDSMAAQANKDLQNAIQAQSSIQAYEQLKAKVATQMMEFSQAAFAEDEQLSMLLQKAANSKDPKDIAAANARQKEVMLMTNYQLRDLIAHTGQIDAQLAKLGAPTSAGGEGVGGDTLDPEIEDLVNTYSGATSSAPANKTDDALNIEIDTQVLENVVSDAQTMSNAGTTSDVQLREMEPMVRKSVSTLGVDAVNAKLAPAGLFWDGKKLTKVG